MALLIFSATAASAADDLLLPIFHYRLTDAILFILKLAPEDSVTLKPAQENALVEAGYMDFRAHLLSQFKDDPRAATLVPTRLDERRREFLRERALPARAQFNSILKRPARG